ncbi:piggyBac transposable element-derived protein 3-like [Homalodisca vitripennis]|uniref:piggyBac transposable element-derived protein 3-like n=1 Tax=Homalodisca vitripennis TaxID=197043 RepID=UPI001EECE64A|nr:piggyBac transposable element-derived protein 3-like [Homalodisca vitripennis]
MSAPLHSCPPDNDDPHNITDEESGERDSNDPDRVCRRQLQAEADIQFEVIENDEDTPIELGDERIGNDCTGTVRANRTEKCPLNDKKIMYIRERGSFESYIDKSDNIAAVASWKDNSVDTLLSNEHGVAPLGEAKRYSVTERKKVSIPQPYRIAQYNRNMGGVDLMDNNISNYRIGVRGKRWYIPIVLWLFDAVMSLVSWLLVSGSLSRSYFGQSQFPKKCGPGFTSKIWTRS